MRVGLITAGSDSPGVNAAIRGFGKAVANTHDMEVLGFRDGYLGLVEDRKVNLLEGNISGISPRVAQSWAPAVTCPSACPVRRSGGPESDRDHHNKLDAGYHWRQ